MEGVVAKPGVGNSLEIGRLDRATVRAACAEPDVIGQDQQDVGSAFGGFYPLREIGDRALHRSLDLALERWLGPGQHLLRQRSARKQTSNDASKQTAATECHSHSQSGFVR